VDRSTGVRSDQTVILTSFQSASAYPDALRRVSYFDKETQKRLKFLTNNFVLPAFTIAQIYKCRWQVELFFKWIKQHLALVWHRFRCASPWPAPLFFLSILHRELHGCLISRVFFVREVGPFTDYDGETLAAGTRTPESDQRSMLS
jgi:hypothetical protein